MPRFAARNTTLATLEIPQLGGLRPQALQLTRALGVIAQVKLEKAGTMDTKSMLIGALVIGVAVLGYLYWDSQQNTVLKAPGVTIKKN